MSMTTNLRPQEDKNEQTTTTTVSPGRGGVSDITENDIVVDPDKGPIGGFDPNYKMPTSWGTKDAPYVYTTADLNLLFKTPSSNIPRWNTLLMKAFPGYKPGTNINNRFDTKLNSQFYKALTTINKMNVDPNSPLRGMSFDKSLEYLAANPVVVEGDKLSSVRVSNPDDLKRVFIQASQSVLGRALSESELNKLVATYQGQEAAYQRSQGGMVTSAPQASTFGVEAAEKAAPVEAEAMEYVGYIGALSQMMQGS